MPPVMWDGSTRLKGRAKLVALVPTAVRRKTAVQAGMARPLIRPIMTMAPAPSAIRQPGVTANEYDRAIDPFRSEYACIVGISLVQTCLRSKSRLGVDGALSGAIVWLTWVGKPTYLR